MVDLRPLKSAGFRALTATICVNELGTWVGEVALAIVVFDRTRSPLATATLFLAMRLAPAALGPLLTARLESTGARLVLSALYAVEALFFAGMAIVARHFSLPAVLVLVALDAALGGAAKALTRGAVAANLMPLGILREGNGIVNLLLVICAALGPALAGLLVAWKGASVALFVDAASFIAAACLVALSTSIRIESDSDATTWGRVRGAYSAIRARPVVARLMVALGATLLLGSVAAPIEVIFAKSTLHAGDFGYGALLGSWGLGAIAGGVAFAVARETRLVTLFAAGTLLMACGYGGLAVSPSLAIACAFSAVGGIGNGCGLVSLVTAVQERIPTNTQSTVYSFVDALNQVMPGIGFVAGGAITALTSPRVAYGASAVGLAVFLVTLYIWRIDRIPLSKAANTADAHPNEGSAHMSEISVTSSMLAPTPIRRVFAVVPG